MEHHKLQLTDLPKYSPWPERLLGLSPWTTIDRTIGKIDQEYDKEKYLRCLEKYDEVEGRISMEEMKKFENGDDDVTVPVSFEDELYTMKLADAISKHYEIISSRLAPLITRGTSLVELASGYGHNLNMLREVHRGKDVMFLGGEYSENAVTLAGKFFRGMEDITVRKFDFYQSSYDILEHAKGRMTVFTVFGVHQLPSAKAFIDGLRPHKDRIAQIVLFEPIDELYDDSLLGLMRKRYNQLCDYNTDILTLLRTTPDIEIVTIEKNMIGLNPLLPLSTVIWKFK